MVERLELQIAQSYSQRARFWWKTRDEQSPLDFSGVLHVTPRYRFSKALNLQQLLRAGKPSQTVCLPPRHSEKSERNSCLREESREIAKRINCQKGSALVADITENLQPRATL